MPQSLRGVPPTEIVAGTGGLVDTRSKPRGVKVPVTSVVAPSFTVIVCGAGVVKPVRSRNETS